MATYKLMQDIEAEDKILGPLTLRQFIFAIVTTFFLYLCFASVTKGLYFLLIFFAPPALLMGFFAFPFGRDQPTEIWALAKLRFWFKPRKRIWDQSGVKELVTITVPKKIEHVYTDGLSKNEVESRLNALANTIDSRGWAVKNVNLNTYNPNPIIMASSDRLVDISSIPQAVPDEYVTASDDILDERNNPIAQQFQNMIAQSEQQHRQRLIDQMNSPAPAVAAPNIPAQQPTSLSSNSYPQAAVASPLNTAAATDQWFMGATPTVAAAATPEEEALVARSKQQLDSREVSYGHLRTLQPGTTGGTQAVLPVNNGSSAIVSQDAFQAPQTVTTAMTDAPDPAILALANNNDFDVATLAREAQKARAKEAGSGDSEVVISLR